MPNPDLSSERRAFEAEFERLYGFKPPHPDSSRRPGKLTANFMWQGWLARSAIPPSDGYVLVPVEPTEAMINSGDGELLNGDRSGKEEIANIWKAMISASQSSREG